jgi:hypothetical protein
MKKALLYTIFQCLFLMANAQNNVGIKITPFGAMPTDLITITIDPNIVCSKSGTPFSDATVVRLHAGVTTYGTPWRGTVGADGTNDAIVGFTRNGNGTWSKSLIPEQYFDVFPDEIEALNFVLNGGPANNPWDITGGYLDPLTNVCGDVLVEFPLRDSILCFLTPREPILELKQIRLHPNPAHDILNIQTKEPIRSVQVYDLLGRVQKTAPAINNQLHVASLPTGMYMLRVVTHSGSQVMRWYKE